MHSIQVYFSGDIHNGTMRTGETKLSRSCHNAEELRIVKTEIEMLLDQFVSRMQSVEENRTHADE